jgi:NitT/TauT family transport system substrate-binding protein
MLRRGLLVLAASGIAMFAAGCGQKAAPTPDVQVEPAGPSKLQIAYLGLTCEPAIFAAYDQGFFKEQGLDVELVRTDWATMREGLASGRFHATYSFIMYLIKPIEMGADIKLTAGIHTGCLRVQAKANTDIKKVEDLKGRKVGITHLGSPPFLFASRILTDKGFDPKHDVEWVTMPAEAMSKALEQGHVDVVASAEPMGTMLIARSKVHTVCDQASDAPYNGEYCCVAAVNGKFARDSPSGAAKVTRALLKGAKWVNANPTAAAKLGVDKNYVSATTEINAQAIAMLKFAPGIATARQDVRTAALAMKKGGFLQKNTDPEELAKNAWLDLDGVTDDWIKNLPVEKVAGGGRPPRLSPAAFARLLEGDSCCSGGVCLGCCGDTESRVLPLGEEWAVVRPSQLPIDHGH